MIRIVTDTASDLSLGEALALGVDIVPLDVRFEGVPYAQLEDDGFVRFYELLESSKTLPTTSQPSPDLYLQIYEEAEAAGDAVVVVTLSSGLSGTYGSATLAKELSGYSEVYILDSKSAVMGQRLLVEYAVKMRTEGKSAAEIFTVLQEAAGRIVLYGALDTLRYLRKGGRIPKSTELVGSMLSIKPIIRLNEEGKIEMAGKARGHAGCVTGLVRKIEESGGIDPTMPVYFGYSQNEAPCKKFQMLACQKFGIKKARRCAVGSTVGTHVGPGCLAVVFLTKE